MFSLIIREEEEGYDKISYEIFWDLAQNHPEAGVAPVKCIEYYGKSLKEIGMIRDGQNEVWFKNLVHDVLSHISCLIYLVPSSLTGGTSSGLECCLRNFFEHCFHQSTVISALPSVPGNCLRNPVHSSSFLAH